MVAQRIASQLSPSQFMRGFLHVDLTNVDLLRVQQKSSPDTREKILAKPSSGYGEGEVFMLISVLVSVLLAGAGDSFMMVVLFSVFFSAGGLVTVVSFCSHAPNRATLASKQIYFFISC